MSAHVKYSMYVPTHSTETCPVCYIIIRYTLTHYTVLCCLEGAWLGLQGVWPLGRHWRFCGCGALVTVVAMAVVVGGVVSGRGL